MISFVVYVLVEFIMRIVLFAENVNEFYTMKTLTQYGRRMVQLWMILIIYVKYV